MSLLESSLLDVSGQLAATADPQAPRASALSARVTEILSASYADIDIRDALATLDARMIQNTAKTRRNLRRDVQKEVIDANGEIVQDFGLVAEQLKSVGAALKKLQTTCAEIRRNVVLARSETKPVLDEAAVLMKQRGQVESKQRVLAAFGEHFLLSDHELSTLTSGADPVGDEFFHVLVKAKRIHADCRALLSSHNQRLGLEVLDQSTKNLNSAFQKLYRGILREFRSLDLENPRINASVRRALRVLAERPTLFQNCLDTFAESRERTLSESFYFALTGEGPGAGGGGRTPQKPIDLSAAEPLRYVGDMLAWAHSTTVSEREALEALFISDGDEIARGIEQGLESEPWNRQVDDSAAASGEEDGDDEDEKPHTAVVKDTFDGARALSQLVNRSLAGVAHLLTQRIEQVIDTHDDAVLAYRIANLITFYHGIFSRLVSPYGFLDALRKAEVAALDRFRTIMRVGISALQGANGLSAVSTPADASAPDFLAPALENVRALLKSYEMSLSSSAAVPTSEETQMGLGIIYAEALDPFLAACGTLASALPRPESDMFSVNCLSQALDALTTSTGGSGAVRAAAAKLTEARVLEIRASIDAHAASLSAHARAFLVSTSGLEPLLAAVDLPAGDAADAAAARARDALLEPAALARASARLDAWLPSAAVDAEGVLAPLRDKALRGEVLARAADLFVADFARLEGAVAEADAADRATAADGDGMDRVDDDAPAEGARRAVFPRTTDEVRVLLS